MRLLVLLLLAVLAGASPAICADWPQHQKDAQRTGRTTEVVPPPYRARWIWLGPGQTLRNAQSVPGWPDDLTSRDGYSYPMPASVNYTIAQSAQPVFSAGRVFIGTQEGNAYAIDGSDGSTLWSAAIQGGTISTAAVAGSVVVFATLSGKIYGFDTVTGSQVWSYQAKKTITTAPCVVSGTVYCCDHSGTVYSLNTANGSLNWTRKLPRPIQGGIACDSDTVYVPCEDLYVYAIRQSDGVVRASRKLRGQSFRMLWPVVFNNRVWTQTCQVPIMGSEYVMESVMASSATFAEEEANIARFLNGDTNGGQWSDASSDWRHLYALNTSDLTEPFSIPCGPIGGVGFPPDPVVIDNQDRVLCWWKTRFPTFIGAGAFGTNYSIDIAAVNQTTGLRDRIQNGPPVNMWPGPETDNTYAFSVMGDWIWLRQTFRGTQMLNLVTNAYNHCVAQARYQDGGGFMADVVYVNNISNLTTTPSAYIEGRCPPIIAGGRVYLAEEFCVTCLESRP